MSRALFPLSTGSHRHSGLTHQAPKHQEMHYTPFIPKITTLLLIQLRTGNLRATASLAGEVFIDTIFDMRDHLLPLKPPGVYPEVGGAGGGAGHSARNNTGLMGEWGWQPQQGGDGGRRAQVPAPGCPGDKTGTMGESQAQVQGSCVQRGPAMGSQAQRILGTFHIRGPGLWL